MEFHYRVQLILKHAHYNKYIQFNAKIERNESESTVSYITTVPLPLCSSLVVGEDSGKTIYSTEHKNITKAGYTVEIK